MMADIAFVLAVVSTVILIILWLIRMDKKANEVYGPVTFKEDATKLLLQEVLTELRSIRFELERQRSDK